MSLDWPEPAGKVRLGVIGWPVAHSLSPVLHRAAFAALGLRDWTYERLPVPPGAMPEALRRLEREGYLGANVTMPHKEAAAQLSVALSDEAARLGAVNTLVRAEDGSDVGSGSGFAGYNTDARGFEAFIREETEIRPEGASVLLYGAGGAARAVALALGRLGVREIVVAARTPSSAGAIAGFFPAKRPAVRVVPFSQAAEERPDLLVNATPVGAAGESLPLPPLGGVSGVVDLLYHPASTPLLESARAAGVPAYGGLGMLVHQAAISFELWTGRRPSVAAMREAGRTALAGSSTVEEVPT